MKTNMPRGGAHARASSPTGHVRQRWGVVVLLYAFSLSASCRAPDSPLPSAATSEPPAEEARAAP